MKDLSKLFIDQEIRSGVDGSVYSIIDDKYCLKIVTKTVDDFFSIADFSKYLLNTQLTIKYLIKNKCKPFVRVYDFNILQVIPNKMVVYSYTMDKCYDISEDEWRVFHTILSHEDNNVVKDLSHSNVEKILKGLAVGLDFDFDRVIMFCDLLRRSEIKHLDLHPRNIMKDVIGNFKLVDLDRLQLEKK